LTPPFLIEVFLMADFIENLFSDGLAEFISFWSDFWDAGLAEWLVPFLIIDILILIVGRVVGSDGRDWEWLATLRSKRK